MKRVGLVGLGDMGIGMAGNILNKGFELTGYDLQDERLKAFKQLGGKPVGGCRDVGKNSDVVFVMVLNGDQVKEVVLGADGLAESLEQIMELLH